MPILKREPDLFPATLLDDDASLAPWWALYTMSRREKDLMRRLVALRLPFYGPLIKRRSRGPAGRTRESFVPLFSGYVFTRGDEATRQLALATGCVSRVLSVPEPAGLVRDLRQIHRLVQCDAPLTPEARLETGQNVRIRSGSMLGLEGRVVERRGREWLIVAVDFLRQGVSLLLEDCQVEPI